MDDSINFIQVNLNRSPKAHYMLQAFIPKTETDMCLLSEPNLRIAKEKNLILDDKGDAAIWITNSDIRVNTLIKGEGYVGIIIEKTLFFSVYISPNITESETEKNLENMGEVLNTWYGQILIGGDFNAWATDWGSTKTDKRGRMIKEWIAEHNLYYMNDGLTPTFIRGIQESFIDLTLGSEQILEHILNWKVRDDEENCSDHRYITFKYTKKRRTELRTIEQKRGWKLDENLIPALKEKILEEKEAQKTIDASSLVGLTCKACDRTLPIKNIGKNKWKPVPWWTENINTLRKECIRKRRILTRSKKRVNNNPDTMEKLLKEYKDAKNMLNTEITKSRNAEWRNVCEEVEQDIWGRGYKIVTKKYNRKHYSLGTEKQKQILDILFPKHETITWSNEEETEDMEEFTMDELITVLIRLKKKKAPGLDGITPEILKIVIETIPEYVLEVFNQILRTGKFPDEWKVGKVVLLLKPGKPNLEPSSYRPLCLLDTYGKFLESMLVNKLNIELGNDGLSQNQFGFRRGRSTIDAIQRIYNIADHERKQKPRDRKLCLLIAFDVRNAFNSASWLKIIEELNKKNVPAYLVRIIKSYLSNRKIVLDEI